MQDHSAAWDDALTGSVVPVVQIDAWYDGELISDPDVGLPGVAGTVTIDSTRLEVTSASITAASPDDTITPTRWGDLLACYGTELNVRAGIRLPGGGVELMSVGWLRVDSFTAEERWQQYQPGGQPGFAVDGGTAAATSTGSVADTGTPPAVSGGGAGGTFDAVKPPVWVPRGVQVPVECSDRMALVDDAQFMAPEQPPSLSSVVAEIQRLCQGVVPVADLSSITDQPIPKSITYDTSRSGAVSALATVLGMVPRIDPDGALSLYPATPTGGPVWTVSVAAGAAPPVAAWTRTGDRSGIYNAVVYQGTASDGSPLQGVATETVGPFRFGGPFGRVPFFAQDPLAVDQAACDAGAAAKLAELAAQRTVIVPVVVPANWALEAGDIVSVVLPDRTVTGPVQTISGVLGVGSMTIGVAVPRADLWAV